MRIIVQTLLILAWPNSVTSRRVLVSSMAGARGTIGFIAPEVFSRSFGVVSTKSDIYSFGMVLLEMVGGRRNVQTNPENSSQIYFRNGFMVTYLMGVHLKSLK